MRSELKLKTIRAFDDDVKRLKKKHYDMGRLEKPLRALRESDADVLKTKYSDHALTGDWKGFHESHVESDLLLVYRRDGDEISLVLVRLDTHDSLFSNSRASRKYSHIRQRRVKAYKARRV